MTRVFWGCVGVAAGALALGAAGHLLAASQEGGPFTAEPLRPMTSRGAQEPPLHVAARPNAPLPPVSDHRTLVDGYCVTCHNQRLATAELMLDTVNIEQVAEHPETWEKVVAKLRAGQMPPVGMPRPDEAAVDAFVAYLETELDRAAAADPNPGRSTLRRLNRTEYTNAIRDLLAIAVEADAFLPIDETQHGFDNIGAALSVTPGLLERYLSAARLISGLAVGEREVQASSFSVKVDPFLRQEERMSEDLPFGSRGGVAIRHYFPADGEYTVKVTLRRNSRGYVIGLYEPHRLDILLDGRRIEQFTVGGGDVMETPGPPFSRSSAIGDQASEAYQLVDVDQNLEARFFATAGERLVGVTFLDEHLVSEYPVLRPRIETEFDRVQWKGGNPAINTVEIRGPHSVAAVGDTPSREKVFVCRPTDVADEEPCAKRILSTLARHAYRRPVVDEDVQALLAVYESGRNEGGFEAGIRAALTRILVGPEFLFRLEREPATMQAGAVYRVSDLELASRLSFFLWSSIPDDELLEVAERGTLKDPVILERQVRRMLADPRFARAFTSNFAAQWLRLRNLSESEPDRELFPQFDENLREAFRRETELLVESMLREDQSVLRLVDADYTFLNERLARHYGIPNVYGSHFRRVTLGPAFDARRGLLGHGSLLTVTSYANRTSVVLRGHWILENLLNAPPPPPPPDVPALESTGAIGELPLRQLMEQHRENPVCSGCHAPMDPLGFALENFNAVGQWRITDAGATIDASALLPDGTAFEGPAGLRQVLLRSPERFVHTVAEKLLTYALGRGVEYYDSPTVREIVRQATRENYRWSSLILATVNSVPFQMRRSARQADQITTTDSTVGEKRQ
ncbi:MAG: DUF1592 domain-containing protein [Gammaproteobacteria bacterium]